MICPTCGCVDAREWKHCCRDKILICADCCVMCAHYNNESTLGGRMCTWKDDRLTEEERKELSLIDRRIASQRAAIKTMKRLDGPIEPMEEHLKYLLERRAELKGE